MISKEKKIKFRLPDTAAFLMIMIVIVALLTFLVPSGQFDRAVDEATGRTLVQAGTFKYVEAPSITIRQVLSSLFRGLVGGADIIAFIFVVGGAFGIISKTGAIVTGLDVLTKKFAGKENILIIILMCAFAVGGGTFGMAEEALPFVAIMVAATKKMGYGSTTGVAVVLIGLYAGYSAGPLNPFNTGIGQGIAELPIFSGIGLRVVLMIGAIAIAAQHTISYGKKYKKEHEAINNQENINEMEYHDASLSGVQKIVLVVLGLSVVALVFGVLKFGWYLEEIAALFMAMGLISGLIFYKGNFEKVGNDFMDGAKDMTIAVMFFGFSRSILVVMEDGMVMDTIVYALSVPLGRLNSVLAAWGMYFSQGIINFFIPSSTGQAAAVMPILTPLSDLIGVTRQTAVLAYQCGDGFWNMITPTHSVVCASIGIAGIGFGDWFKFAWKLVFKWSIWVLIILSFAVMTNYGPF